MTLAEIESLLRSLAEMERQEFALLMLERRLEDLEGSGRNWIC